MSEKIVNFRDLDVWKLGKELVVDIYKATKTFPNEETYGLVAQMRRAAISIPSNPSLKTTPIPSNCFSKEDLISMASSGLKNEV